MLYKQHQQQQHNNVMKLAMLKATIICVFITGILICVTYTVSKFSYKLSDRVQFIGDKNKNQIKSPPQSKIFKRRLVNRIGNTFADEQPNLNELREWHIESLRRQDIRKRHVTMTSYATVFVTNENVSSQSKVDSQLSPQMGSVTNEDDPKINDNIIPISFKFFVNNNKLTDPACTSDSPITHVVSLLTQQTGVETINNIIYRYGDFKNEYFALPKPHTYQYYWPLRFHASYVDKTVLNRAAPNFLLNGARNNNDAIKNLVSNKAFQLAILRNPVDHFFVVFEHTGISKLMRLINNSEDVFAEFSVDPLSNIDKILNFTKQFQPKFHLLKNAQLFDLGFELNDYKTKHDLQFVIQQLDEQLDFVLIFEYLDESLVLLQRLLCWQLEDMIYLKSRITTTRNRSMSKETKENIRKWNNEDVRLYTHFNNTLWRRIRQHQDEMFWGDVTKLKTLTHAMDEECSRQKHGNRKTNDGVQSSTKVNKFVMARKGNGSKLLENTEQELSNICDRLFLDDRDYVMLLRSKQKQRLREQYDALLKDQFLTNETSNNGKFLYALKFFEQEQKNTNESNFILNNQSEIPDDNGIESHDSENEVDVKILTL